MKTLTARAYPALSATFLIAVCTLPIWIFAQNSLKTAEIWPTRPVRTLVGFPGGSTPDMAARTLARALGQAVIIENRPGASSPVPTQEENLP